MLYVDTSALAKLIIIERQSEVLRAYLRTQRLVSSALTLAELPRAIRRGYPGLTSDVVSVLEMVGLMEVDHVILATAGRMAPPTLRTLDAIHLATALAFGDELTAVVTYDRRMADAARDLGMAVASPE